MNLGKVNYASDKTPSGYKCTTCGAFGCKLWREYQTCADYSELVCCDCAGKSQGKDVSQIDERGNIPWSDMGDMRIDQIGWRVPAVPTEGGDAFWGYTSVPQAGCNWWYALPTRANAKAV